MKREAEINIFGQRTKLTFIIYNLLFKIQVRYRTNGKDFNFNFKLENKSVLGISLHGSPFAVS